MENYTLILKYVDLNHVSNLLNLVVFNFSDNETQNTLEFSLNYDEQEEIILKDWYEKSQYSEFDHGEYLWSIIKDDIKYLRCKPLEFRIEGNIIYFKLVYKYEKHIN